MAVVVVLVVVVVRTGGLVFSKYRIQLLPPAALRQDVQAGEVRGGVDAKSFYRHRDMKLRLNQKEQPKLLHGSTNCLSVALWSKRGFNQLT